MKKARNYSVPGSSIVFTDEDLTSYKGDHWYGDMSFKEAVVSSDPRIMLMVSATYGLVVALQIVCPVNDEVREEITGNPGTNSQAELETIYNATRHAQVGVAVARVFTMLGVLGDLYPEADGTIAPIFRGDGTLIMSITYHAPEGITTEEEFVKACGERMPGSQAYGITKLCSCGDAKCANTCKSEVGLESQSDPSMN